MPWKEWNAVSLKEEFRSLAVVEGANVSLLCRRFGISRKTGYKWLRRYIEDGVLGLTDRARRPQHSPTTTDAETTSVIVELRQTHPAWGARKLRTRLQALGHRELPAASTIQAILKREGLVASSESQKHRAFTRFEHEAPNDLWQMDFKGHFPLTSGARCHPLTVLDDHSRYAIRLAACGNERHETVRAELVTAFRRYGLPRRMLMDNGPPWSGGADEPYTVLTVWLLRLSVAVSHGRPFHPQTQGKDERFHRTLKAEVLVWEQFTSLVACQRRFDPWRDVYNLERPHEALGMQTPATRYQPSERAYPETLPAIEYGPGDMVRQVSIDGTIHFRGHEIKLSKAFRGQPVALRPSVNDGAWDVYYCQHEIGQLDLRGEAKGRAAVPSFVRCAHFRRHRESPEMETQT